jgi:hypothetical protein
VLALALLEDELRLPVDEVLLREFWEEFLGEVSFLPLKANTLGSSLGSGFLCLRLFLLPLLS